MTQYIDKDVLVTEIEKIYDSDYKFLPSDIVEGIQDFKDDVLINIDTLEVKESNLPNPRFPHLDNIVDKVFGAGNLESWKYEEAKQLVLLAKEELLKDIEVKEVDLEKVFLDEYSKFSNDVDAMDYAFPIDLADYKDFAKHFFELGLKVQKRE